MAESTAIYLKEIREDRGLGKQQTIDHVIKAQGGDMKSQDIVVKNHLLLVVKIAREYAGMGVEIPDLISEGNIGLINAIKKYDASRGTYFSTCAAFWIRQSIIRNCMHNKRLVRIPEHISELIRTDRWEGNPFIEFSIDKPNDEGDTMSESIQGPTPVIPFEDENMKILRGKIFKFLSVLKERDAEIVKKVFGIDTEDEMEVQKVAELFNLTTTRINQILRTSLEEMKNAAEKERETQPRTYQPEISSSIEIIEAKYGTGETWLVVTENLLKHMKHERKVKVSNALGGDPKKGAKKTLIVSWTDDGVQFDREFPEGTFFHI